MKPSNLTSPRAMNECIFMFNADPIERPESHRVHMPRWTKWFGVAVVGLALLSLTACGSVPVPCDPQRLNCDNGTRATGGAVSRPAPATKPGGPSESNNPGKPSGGGQVGSKPGHGHGDKNHGHSGPPGKGRGGKGK